MLILDCEKCRVVTDVIPVRVFSGYVYVCLPCIPPKYRKRFTSAHQSVTPSSADTLTRSGTGRGQHVIKTSLVSVSERETDVY